MRHPMEEAVIDQMAALSAALAAGGTTLVYVSVPSKSQAMPQFLPRLASDYAYDSATATMVYDDIIDRLSAKGVLAPDILSALVAAPPETPPFFQADFHWTSDGARLSAEVISAAIKAQPAYADLAVAEFKTKNLGPTTAFSTMRRTLQAFCVDELPRVDAFNYVTEVTSAPASGAADIFADDGDALQIVLVGTSFSDSPSGSFAGYLSEHTGLDVVNYAITGGNQFGAMTSYLTSRDFADNPPRFLIWENPIYNNLAQFGPDPMEELIAAAGTTCAHPLDVTQTGPNSLTADLSKTPLGQNDVIRADLGADGSRKVSFDFQTATGIARHAQIERGDRMLAAGRYFKPLGSIWHPDFTKVTVTFDRQVNDTSSLTLCPFSEKAASQ